jgi:hypothetical protein
VFADLLSGAVKPRGVVHRRYLSVVDEILNLTTESQFILLSEEGEVLEEELMPSHGKKHTLIFWSGLKRCWQVTIPLVITLLKRKNQTDSEGIS